jgi:predicted transcriptional regulator
MQPSGSELKLLRALWGAQRLSAREVHEASLANTRWSYSATRKTLDRMEDKGLVKVEIVHGVRTYAAARPKLETLAGLIKDFARSVLDADAPMPAATFANSRLLDEGEIEALKALLDSESEDSESDDAKEGEP